MPSHSTISLISWILPKQYTFSDSLSTAHRQQSSLSPRPSPLSPQPSALSTQHSALQNLPTANCQLFRFRSALSTQHSALVTIFLSTEKLKSNKLVFLVILYTANNLNRRCIIAQVIIRNIEDDLKIRLKVRATQHGWSIEEEVCQILRTAVTEASPTRQRLGSRIAARFAGVGLLEPLPELRGHTIAPMDFGA